MPNVNNRHLATAGGIGAILLWSFTVALIRRISEQIGPITGAACVFAVGTIFCILSLSSSSERRRRIGQLPRPYMIYCGLLFVGYMLFLFLAVGAADSRSQALEVGLVNYSWPALTLVLSVLILGYKAKWLLLPGTLCALCGVFLVLTSNAAITWGSLVSNVAANPAAYLLGFAAALSWGLYSTLTRKWVREDQGGAVDVFIPATAIALFLASLLVDEPRAWNFNVLIDVAIFGSATFFSYNLWDRSMRGGNFVFVAASSYSTPFFSTVVTCLVLSIAPTFQLWLGCAVLIAGSMLSWVSVHQTPSQEFAGQAAAVDENERRGCV